jgi:ribosomal protein S19
MSRSKWKGNFLTNDLLKKTVQLNNITQRSSIIPSNCLGKFVYIYTGKELKKIFISKEKIGLKFGSFAYTRKGKMKNKIVRKKK